MPDTGLLPGRFVQGTGRCGSTLLSKIFAENQKVLSLFEWFSGLDQFFRFRPDAVSWEALAHKINQDHPVLTEVLRRGLSVPEVTYPFGPDRQFKSVAEAVPWNQAIAMPRLTDDPDTLFAELLSFVSSAPEQSLALHYQSIFQWLTERCGRQTWIERSAGSIDFVHELEACFPGSRYVHLHRDGREVALSMREYPALRVAVVLMNGLVGDIEFTYEGLTDMVAADDGTIDQLLNTRPAVELYGEFWSGQVERGQQALAGIESERILDIRFEDLVAEPLQTIERVAEFFKMPADPGWQDRAAALVRGVPHRRFTDLGDEEQLLLNKACAAGMAALNREMD